MATLSCGCGCGCCPVARTAPAGNRFTLCFCLRTVQGGSSTWPQHVAVSRGLRTWPPRVAQVVLSWVYGGGTLLAFFFIYRCMEVRTIAASRKKFAEGGEAEAAKGDEAGADAQS